MLDEFKVRSPKNYEHNQLFCGGIHQEDNPGTNCGVCGDSLADPVPRDNEIGGKYYTGIITGNYSSGGIIEAEVVITAEHLGYMQFRLCLNPATETQSCFNRHLLRLVDGGTNVGPVTATGLYKAVLQLPKGVRCDHCILQWNYRAGNNWGDCDDGVNRPGCGRQETFRGCADISIQ